MPDKMSKGFYMGGYIAGFVLAFITMTAAIVFLVISISQHPDDFPWLAFGFFALAFLPMVFSIVVYMMFLYRMWSAIQDGFARTTPGKAVGFMFIPIFNFYWIFQVILGFAEDYNRYIARHQIKLPPLDEQLFLYYPIAILCTMVPFVGGMAALAGFVLLLMIMGKVCDAVNALPARQVSMPAQNTMLPQ
jgi:hypothetical protein